MAELREFLGAADEITASQTRYVLRSTTASVRALHRYEQLIGCLARRQVTPVVLHDALARFSAEQAAGSAAKVRDAASRFIAALMSSTFLPVDGTDAPHEHDEAAATEPERMIAAAVEKYHARLADIAAGALGPDAFRRDLRKHTPRMLAEETSRLAAAWFEYLGDVEEERARLAADYLLDVLRTAHPVGFDGEVVELGGPLDTTARAVVVVESGRDESVVVGCGATDVRSADGVGPAFAPDLVITPGDLVLEPDREGAIELALLLDGTIYAAGSTYVGALRITCNGNPQRDLPLRITPTASAA